MPINEADRLPVRLRKFAVRFANSLMAFISVHPTITLQLVRSFLIIAAEEGLTVSALAIRTGASPTKASRHVQDLGNTNRHGRRGLELVTVAQRAHGDHREQRLYLTERGRALVRQMTTNYLSGPTWRILSIDEAFPTDPSETTCPTDLRARSRPPEDR